MPPTRRRLPRAERARRAAGVANGHGGVAHRRDPRAVGISRADVRTEVEAGRWLTAGRHTVVQGNTAPAGEALLWRAVWETGSGAALDGVAAMVAGGLTGFDATPVDVSIPRATAPTASTACGAGCSTRWSPTCATAGTLWASSTSQGCAGSGTCPSRAASSCARSPGGRAHLDVAWEHIGLVVEIDGGHHALALEVVDDALRANELVLREDRVLRVPLIGLRVAPDRFMAQVREAHRLWSPRVA